MLTGQLRKNLVQEERFCAPLVCGGGHVVLMSAPYSQERTPASYNSGELFITHDLYGSAENFRNCATDVVVVMKWLELRGVRRRVLVGLSVGGI
jgi:hypothetical protein